MASGDLIAAVIEAFAPDSNYAEFDETAVNYPLWDFDDSTTETIYFKCYMSGAYDGTSNIKVIIPWKFSTYVGSQTCDWEVSFYRVADDADSIEAFTFPAAQAVLATEASATGELDYASITFTNAQADGIQPNGS